MTLLEQYHAAKAVCPEALLLFQMGDFYEAFHDDARTLTKIIGLTLTTRDKTGDRIPMTGFPHWQLETYLRKLIAAGYRCAICEQVTEAKGVKREISRVMTEGSLTE